MIDLENLYQELKKVEDMTQNARHLFEEVGRKINWDLRKADEESIEKLRQLWGEVEFANEKYAHASDNLKKGMFGVVR